jgi:hypothetical protein
MAGYKSEVNPRCVSLGEAIERITERGWSIDEARSQLIDLIADKHIGALYGDKIDPPNKHPDFLLDAGPRTKNGAFRSAAKTIDWEAGTIEAEGYDGPIMRPLLILKSNLSKTIEARIGNKTTGHSAVEREPPGPKPGRSPCAMAIKAIIPSLGDLTRWQGRGGKTALAGHIHQLFKEQGLLYDLSTVKKELRLFYSALGLEKRHPKKG